MFEEELLAEQFQSLVSHAQQVEKEYASLADDIDDPELLEQIRTLHRVKQRHVLMAERLLQIVE